MKKNHSEVRKKMILGLRVKSRFCPRAFCSRAHFESHYGELAILRGLSEGSIVRGTLSVSQYNNARGRVLSNNKERISCVGFVNRNRALSGDRVFVKILAEKVDPIVGEGEPSEEFRDIDSIRTIANKVDEVDPEKSGRVVGIEERMSQRIVARLRPKEELLQPRDSRFPAMRLVPSLQAEKNTLTLVKFKEWAESELYPDCNLIRVLGLEGEFDAEDDSSLEMNGLVSEPFSNLVDQELRSLFPDSQSVVDSELPRRRDCRTSERVFTIDPPTARDLDDAISITEIGNGLLRIAVHVADVSFFVNPKTELDTQARERATSVYLPRKVYPMLPPYLSENLCSLLPGSDRLSFSVYFTLEQATGAIVGTPEFVRTVIRSIVKLSYDEVDSQATSIPAAVAADIALLMTVTEKLRNRRIESGSISLDDRNSDELKFEFAEIPGKSDHAFPISLITPPPAACTSHNSHILIEELMVLTNKLIAEKLAASPELAAPVVRKHLESESAVREAAVEYLSQAGVAVDLPNSKSLTQIFLHAKASLPAGLMSAFSHTVLGEFSRAEYVLGTGAHWGVGAERYMHFTSPIRRYADLIVHRKLARILGYPTSDVDSDETNQIQICNTNSRAAQDAEKDNKLFYFGTFVKAFGNAGYAVDGIVKNLIPPSEERGTKGALSVYLPIVAEVRSQSLESLGLEFISAHEGGLDVKSKAGDAFAIKLLSTLKLRAFVKNPTSPTPRFHLRMGPLPEAP